MAYIDKLRVNDSDYDIGANLLVDGSENITFENVQKAVEAAVVTVSSSQPSDMKNGDLWYQIVT